MREVMSENNFPAGAGIASSAAAFAAFALASSHAAGLTFLRRSYPGWHGADRVPRHAPSPADLSNGRWALVMMTLLQFPFASEHWALVDCIAIVSASHKRLAPRKVTRSQGQVRCRMRAWQILLAGWIFAAMRSSTKTLKHSRISSNLTRT